MSDRTDKQPLISVFMPVYNREKYIRECIDSILCQSFTDFELVVVDDGSTDHTCEIIESYKDTRIRLIRNRHDFIESSNIALSECRGRYMARMDSDDVMMPERLKVEYDYMESHPEVDILGASMTLFGDGVSPVEYNYPPEVGIRELYSGCPLSCPTVMIRRERFIEKGLHYEREAIYAEDYLLWTRAAIAGLRIRNIPDILVRYRVSSTQVTNAYNHIQNKGVRFVHKVIRDWLTRDEAEWAGSHPVRIPDTSNRLTIIMPFLNEGDEVANTVRSIREYAGDSVEIIVINDQSDDGYPYRERLEGTGVHYVYNAERLGVAASRDYGVSLCKTPYFLLLDAHMRFYDDKWTGTICNLLKENDRRILCCQTRVLTLGRNGDVVWNKECPTTYGAYIPFDKKHYWPDIEWNCKSGKSDSPTEPIAAVLGAGYAASKRYWERIKGLRGLKSYGSDEAYLSLKTWLEGGQCILLKDIVIGHIYRTSSPYKRYTEDEVYNSLAISYMLFPPPVVLSESDRCDKDQRGTL